MVDHLPKRFVTWKFIFTSATLSILILFTLHLSIKEPKNWRKRETSAQVTEAPLHEQALDFAVLNYSNETGHPLGLLLVPNYIHFVYFGGVPIRYIHFICILAAFKNQKPDKIFFHFDNTKTFSGKYWETLQKTKGFSEILFFDKVELPDEIFGQELNPQWRKWHGSDIMRIRVLMKYGGIYLDNDCYLVNSVDRYRKFETTVAWDQNQFMGNQVLIAHKSSRFLKKYLDSYRKYESSKWYYNGGERPTREILYKEPELVHRVKELFGVATKFIHHMFQRQWKDWRKMYVVHLLANHQYLLKNLTAKATFPVVFDEFNIPYYPVTFRDMAYDVYDVANITWPKHRLGR